jgi:hypothetical protein
MQNVNAARAATPRSKNQRFIRHPQSYGLNQPCCGHPVGRKTASKPGGLKQHTRYQKASLPVTAESCAGHTHPSGSASYDKYEEIPVAAHPKPTPGSAKPEAERKRNADPCDSPIDRNAPAGSPSSLGAKSDCNGRPTTDDSVVEARDEQPPLPTPPGQGNERGHP